MGSVCSCNNGEPACASNAPSVELLGGLGCKRAPEIDGGCPKIAAPLQAARPVANDSQRRHSRDASLGAHASRLFRHTVSVWVPRPTRFVVVSAPAKRRASAWSHAPATSGVHHHPLRKSSAARPPASHPAVLHSLANPRHSRTTYVRIGLASTPYSHLHRTASMPASLKMKRLLSGRCRSRSSRSRSSSRATTRPVDG